MQWSEWRRASRSFNVARPGPPPSLTFFVGPNSGDAHIATERRRMVGIYGVPIQGIYRHRPVTVFGLSSAPQTSTQRGDGCGGVSDHGSLPLLSDPASCCTRAGFLWSKRLRTFLFGIWPRWISCWFSVLTLLGNCLSYEDSVAQQACWSGCRARRSVRVRTSLPRHHSARALGALTMVMTEPFPIQRMPRLPTWPWVCASVTSVFTIGFGVWLGSWLMIIPMAFIIFGAWYLHTRMRCPRCSRRLRSRSVAIDQQIGRAHV